MSNIKLQSSDGEMFDVEVKIAECLGIRDKVEELGMEGEKEEIVVKLPKVNSEILSKIIEWVTHNEDDSPSSSEDDSNKDKATNDTWNANLEELDDNIFFNLMLAAYELNIQRLVAVTCKIIANRMTGKSTEEMRKMFNIKNDLTPEEIQKFREENNWYE